MSILFRKLQEVAGLRLTFVQEIYWRAVQRRMVMGQLEKFMENVIESHKYRENYKYNIPYKLAVSLMSGDEGMMIYLSNENIVCAIRR